MKIQGIISATVLMLSAVLSAPAFACHVVDSDAPLNDGPLAKRAQLNQNLSCGDHEFANLHVKRHSSFTDKWEFTVASDTTASISVYDYELDLSALGTTPHLDTTKIFDTKNLSFSLYNDDGDLLGKAYENQTLSGLSLLAGQWYTLKVSGKVNGLFGSVYNGSIETCVTQVPLGDSAPMLGSALALLAFSYRKRLAKNA